MEPSKIAGPQVCASIRIIMNKNVIVIVNVDNDGEDGDGGICVNLARDLQ